MEINKKLVIKLCVAALLIVITLVAYAGKSKDDIIVSYGDTGSVENSAPGEEDDGNASGGAIDRGKSEYGGTRGSIYVDVAGAVNNATVVEMAEGSRVFQAIAKAGGASRQAVTKFMNLAAVLSDGDKIYVPSESEVIDRGDEGVAGSVIGGVSVNTGSENGSGSGTAANNGLSSGGLININEADSAALQTLSGIGPSTAEKIIEYREQNGPFSSVEDLKNVTGIGEKTLAKFVDKICVE